jgi:hypothetical protein
MPVRMIPFAGVPVRAVVAVRVAIMVVGVLVLVAMIAVMMMVVVVIMLVMVGRGTSAGCAHGGLLKIVWKKGIRFSRQMQY